MADAIGQKTVSGRYWRWSRIVLWADKALQRTWPPLAKCDCWYCTVLHENLVHLALAALLSLGVRPSSPLLGIREDTSIHVANVNLIILTHL